MKRACLWLFSLMLMLLLFIALLPPIFSTTFGNELLQGLINKRISGKLSIEHFHIRWFGTQVIENLKLEDSSGRLVISLPYMETRSSLFSLFARHFGTSRFDKPYFYFARDKEGHLNIDKALTKKKIKKKSQGKFPTFTGSFNLREGKFIYDSPTLHTIIFTDINVDYTPDKDIFHIKAQTEQGDVKGEIFASGNLSKQFHILAEIQNFPVAIIDQLGVGSFYQAAIGQTLNIKIETKKEAAVYSLTTAITSSNLNGVLTGEISKGNFVIDPRQSQLIYTLTPATFKELLGPVQQTEWKLGAPSEFALIVEKGIIPIRGQKFSWNDLQFVIDSSLPRLEITSEKTGPYSLNDFHTIITKAENLEINSSARLQGKEESKLALSSQINSIDDVEYTFAAEGLPFTLLELFFEEATFLHDFLGDSLCLHLCGGYKNETFTSHIEMDSLTIIKFDGNIQGTADNLDFEMKGIGLLQNEWKEVFGSEVVFKFKGHAAFSQKNLSLISFAGSLQNPYFDVEIKGGGGKEAFAYDHLRLELEGKLLQLPLPAMLPGSSLKSNHFTLSVNGAKNEITANGTLAISVETASGKAESKESDFHLVVKNFIKENNSFDFKNASYEFSAILEHFPLAVIEPLFAGGKALSILVGPFVDAKTSGLITAGSKQSYAEVKLNAKSEGFSADIALSLTDELLLKQQSPTTIHCLLNPQKYRALMQLLNKEDEANLYLMREATIDFEMKELSCPAQMPESVREFLCQSGFVGSVKISPLFFKNAEEELTLENIYALIRGRNFSEKIEVTLTGDVVAPNLQTPDPSAFSFVGELKDLWSPKAELQKKNFSLAGEMSLEFLPVSQIADLLPMQQKYRAQTKALLGDLLNTRIRANLLHGQGAVTVDVKASNFKALLPLQLTSDGLLLRDMVEAEITLTEEISNEFFVDITPLITAAYSEHPLKLYIEPEGFFIPLYPFSLKGIVVQKGVLDIGKVQIQNGKHIQALMEFLKAEQISNDKWMEAWFTPIFFSFIDGTVIYKRFDILLASQAHIALWGRIDIAKDKIRMTLGISPATLAQRFGIVGLTKDEMFQVKIRGKSSDVELDWSSAYTRIGILVARLTGGHIGYLLGGVVEQVLNILGEETSPAPTTDPLPWDQPGFSLEQQTIPEEAAAPSPKKRGMKRLLQFLMP